MALQHALQVMRAQERSIDHEIGAVAQRTNALALELDAVGQRPLPRQRMTAARLGVAALEPLVVAIEEDDVEIELALGGEAVECLNESRNREVARAHIDADGERQMGRGWRHQIGQKRQRQIVDRLIAHILECLERRGASRAGHAGDHQQPLGRAGARIGHRATSGAARSARRSFAATEASKGASASSGTLRPRRTQAEGSGMRSTAAEGTRSTTMRKGAAATLGTRTRPSPRTSIWPAIVAGAVIEMSPPSRLSSV